MKYEPEILLRDAMALEASDSPFPWQMELLRRFLDGNLPDACDIPTGLGKTSVMDIWLVARCFEAPVPRRLVYVVDRRAVVDQATEAARRLRNFVEDHPELKERLGLTGASLPISTLRGQFVDNREWLSNPAWPAIIVGTVDMIGSRLLFEGYGVSRRMRPFHAGLLGVDTLLVLDEAHLVPPFEHLLRSIAAQLEFRPRNPCYDRTVPRFALLPLSATSRDSSTKALRLTGEDRQHPVLRKRLEARKSLWLTPLDEQTSLADALAKHAWHLSGSGKEAVRIVVFSDSRKTAQQAKEAIEKLAKGDRKQIALPAIETELLVGARRVFEREAIRNKLGTLGFLAGSRTPRSQPVFLFATSAGEVGVDLDADHMVCDLVAWERMVQRLGRVNRRGEALSPAGAQIVVLIEPKPKMDNRTRAADQKRSSGQELPSKELQQLKKYEAAVRNWELRQQPFHLLPRNENGSIDASVDAICRLQARASCELSVQRSLTDASSPEPLRPALSLPLVEAWSLTALSQHPGRPEIQPWLRGWVDEEPQTSIVWRSVLPLRRTGEALTVSAIETFFEAAPLHVSEILETATYLAAEWLQARAKDFGKSPQNSHAGEREEQLPVSPVVAFVLSSDGTLRKLLTHAELKSIDKKLLNRALSDATLVVDARLAGLKNGLLDEKESSPPLTCDNSDWLGPGSVGFRIRRADASAPPIREREWRERLRFPVEVSVDGEPLQWLVIDKWQNDAATEDDRAESGLQLLDQHQARVETRASELAGALNLPDDLRTALALAARFHDEGKRAPRWQRAFHAPHDGVYAKTDGPINQSLLDGFRHELGSLLRAENDPVLARLSPEFRDLVLHLISAHHGFARPLIPISGCDDAPPSILQEKAAQAALRFARLQELWGPWGLAWCETLLRAADQLASREITALSGLPGGA